MGLEASKTRLGIGLLTSDIFMYNAAKGKKKKTPLSRILNHLKFCSQVALASIILSIVYSNIRLARCQLPVKVSISQLSTHVYNEAYGL